jgi:hypothetical protein
LPAFPPHDLLQPQHRKRAVPIHAPNAPCAGICAQNGPEATSRTAPRTARLIVRRRAERACAPFVTCLSRRVCAARSRRVVTAVVPRGPARGGNQVPAGLEPFSQAPTASETLRRRKMMRFPKDSSHRGCRSRQPKADRRNPRATNSGRAMPWRPSAGRAQRSKTVNRVGKAIPESRQRDAVWSRQAWLPEPQGSRLPVR